MRGTARAAGQSPHWQGAVSHGSQTRRAEPSRSHVHNQGQQQPGDCQTSLQWRGGGSQVIKVGWGEAWYNAGCRQPCNEAQTRSKFISAGPEGRGKATEAHGVSASLIRGGTGTLCQDKTWTQAAKPTGGGRSCRASQCSQGPYTTHLLITQLKTWINSDCKLPRTWRRSKILASLCSLH